MELDEELRSRLQQLAQQDEAALDDAARRRIRSAVHARAHKRTHVVWLLAPAVLVSSAFAWWVVTPSRTLQPEPAAHETRDRNAAPAAPAAPREVPETVPQAIPSPLRLTRERALPAQKHAVVVRPVEADAGPRDAGYELWRQGELPAFQPVPPEIPSSLQPDGRPMKKPQLVP